MRKLTPAAFLLSGIFVFGSLFVSSAMFSTPAFAEDEDESTSLVQEDDSSVQEVEQGERPEHSPKDKRHEEIEQKFGKQGRLAFPPMVIRPLREASAGSDFVAVNPALKDAGVSVSNGTAVSPERAVYPERNVPIDISNVKLTRKTPADVFIQASQVGLYAMAGGALVLSAIAASRAIRRK
jgi:hypothetical protein